MLVKLDHFPKDDSENEKHLKPPPTKWQPPNCFCEFVSKTFGEALEETVLIGQTIPPPNLEEKQSPWLVVEPTPLKNMLVKMGSSSFPKVWGENQKYV